MTHSRYLPLLPVFVCAAAVCLAQGAKDPHIGYLYPGGGRRGTTFEVTVGGQMLRGVKEIYVSGDGVRAKIVHFHRPRRNLMLEQRNELVRQLRIVWQERISELPPEKRRGLHLPGVRMNRMAAMAKRNKNKKKGKGQARQQKGQKEDPELVVELPKHPLLRDLEKKSIRELVHVADTFLNYRNLFKRQLNSQIAELLLIKVTIDADAKLGERELRLGSSSGLTNPMAFHVGTLPEALEQEPNDPKDFDPIPKDPPLELPVAVNGQILPGDVDRFRFKAKRGQQLVIETYARRLVPFLADAVPGWFQATVAVYDSKGHEVAFADDYRFRPDPVLFCEIPADGIYELEVRDSIFRGREDFVYRTTVGELPFITRIFPLGGRAGKRAVATVDGLHLPNRQITLDTSPEGPPIRHASINQDGRMSNEVVYAVDTLPECMEAEPNDSIEKPQPISLPHIINGHINRPGDVDVFRFEARSGDTIVAEVQARRLHSPVDSLVRVLDASGKVIAWNDDYMQKEGHLHPDMGFLTHHADSYVMAKLPKRGTYFVHLADTQHRGGGAFSYRLRMARPQPDFVLWITPSSLNAHPGRPVPLTVHALRKDGFDGDIKIALKNAPEGFVLTGGEIRKGSNHVRVTLTAPAKQQPKPIPLQFEGRAKIKGKEVVRPVAPSDNTMQAFLWRHLAPAKNLMLSTKKARWAPPPLKLASATPIQVRAGGTTDLRIDITQYMKARKIELKLDNPPKGVSLGPTKVSAKGITCPITVAKDAPKGLSDNLIVEASMEVEWRQKPKKKGGKEVVKTRRVSLGILPAIPFEIKKR